MRRLHRLCSLPSRRENQIGSSLDRDPLIAPSAAGGTNTARFDFDFMGEQSCPVQSKTSAEIAVTDSSLDREIHACYLSFLHGHEQRAGHIKPVAFLPEGFENRSLRMEHGR